MSKLLAVSSRVRGMNMNFAKNSEPVLEENHVWFVPNSLCHSGSTFG